LKRTTQAFSSFWLIRAFSSSIGKKVVIAVTGLALCGFLIVHLGGNLLLYVGADKYNHYADTLHAQEHLLLVAEIGLLVLFVGHIWLAFSTKTANDAARPVDYAVQCSKMDGGPLSAPASSVMFGTGIMVFLFLLLHLSDFRFELRHGKEIEHVKPYAKAIILLRDEITFVVYIAGSAALGYHVLHGLESAFQTLGLNHARYTPIVKFLSLVFAITVAAGFGSFPLWAWAFKHVAEG
jgi:succinate dehydrogenase / fumarate reductase cytochrome b subunit